LGESVDVDLRVFLDDVARAEEDHPAAVVGIVGALTPPLAEVSAIVGTRESPALQRRAEQPVDLFSRHAAVNTAKPGVGIAGGIGGVFGECKAPEPAIDTIDEPCVNTGKSCHGHCPNASSDQRFSGC